LLLEVGEGLFELAELCEGVNQLRLGLHILILLIGLDNTHLEFDTFQGIFGPLMVNAELIDVGEFSTSPL
jgi:hypothetical protein